MDSTKLGKFKIVYPNKREYHSLKREIWNQDIYYFETNKDTPFIIDIGAHIGISVLYFKALFPNSKILAFEPNPLSFGILEENIQSNGLKDITLINKAIHSQECISPFYIDNSNEEWNSNSSLLERSWSGRENTKAIEVSCTRLDPYLVDIKEIDLLKIDTEGTELEILNSHKNILEIVNNISVEYHPTKGKKTEKILTILQPYFKLEIYSEGKLLQKPLDGKLLTIQGKKRV